MGATTTTAIAGSCYCGNIRVEIGLTADPATYEPRACDCDFCRLHGSSYVSDNNCWMRLTARDETALQRFRQGSGQADMLLCKICGVLVGAAFEDDDGLFAVPNSRIFPVEFGQAQTSSPKLLGAVDKAARWKEIWFQDVMIGSATAPTHR